MISIISIAVFFAVIVSIAMTKQKSLLSFLANISLWFPLFTAGVSIGMLAYGFHNASNRGWEQDFEMIKMSVAVTIPSLLLTIENWVVLPLALFEMKSHTGNAPWILPSVLATILFIVHTSLGFCVMLLSHDKYRARIPTGIASIVLVLNLPFLLLLDGFDRTLGWIMVWAVVLYLIIACVAMYRYSRPTSDGAP
ncbi:MAG: hypothetical protein AAB508_03220 [Patescibacteria group bacterium]